MSTTPNPHLELRLLGGFRVSRDGVAVGGFESQKVRGLLSYLAVERGRSFSRDRLAALLWPEESEDRARRNLRQAIYNLRQILDQTGGEELLEVTRQDVGLSADPRLWLDVRAFEEHLRRARDTPEPVRSEELAAAARLYAGDFLAGFHVDDALELEEWLITEQERLREGAIEALLHLMQHHLEAGSYSLGVEYGRRLTQIDPLSETARRRLMRLHAYSGRRSRAISEYQELERLLGEELGVTPVEETTAEYRAILAEEVPGPTVREKAEPVGPLVPLAGRETALARLREIWSGLGDGRGRTTLVVGEAGIGKTRMIKTFLHEVTRDRPVLILQGRYHEGAPPIPYQGLTQALEDGVIHEVEVAERLTTHLAPATRATLALLIPALDELSPGPAPTTPPPEPEDRKADLSEALAAALGALGRVAEGEPDQPVILFLDDLHAADPSSLEVFRFLHRRLEEERVWLLGAWSSGTPPPDGVETIDLGRLEAPAVREIAAALVPGRHDDLAHLLERGDGLPLAITELINLLWDEGHLVEHQDGSWSLRDPPPPDRLPGTLEEIVRFRLSDLPSSTRRLFTLAAVAGPEFDARLLEEAEQEHDVVVEAGIRMLLERWMGRLRLGYWADSRKERDVSLWATGPARSSFEFSHPTLRRIVYDALDPERRAVLHRRVAEVLAERAGSGSSRRLDPALGFHSFRGGAWERAVHHLEAAAREALRLRAAPTAAHECRRALEALAALEREQPERDAHWREIRRRLEALGNRAADRA